jgi:restriction endonuclease S subunit
VPIISVIRSENLENTKRIDAEYYDPSYLKLETDLAKTGMCEFLGKINGDFITGPFGSEFNVENYVDDSTYRYIRGKDVKEFFLQDKDNAYLPKQDFDRLKKHSLKEGDILISVVGTIGNSVVVDKKNVPSIFSCKSTVYRTNTISPLYLITYLNSKFGRSFLLRNVRGTVQTGLNIGDLKSIPIFLAPSNIQKNIENMVCDAKKYLDDSKNLYLETEKFLLDKLMLTDFHPKYDLSYTTNYSNIVQTHRMDAEYFIPVYEKMISILQSEFEIKELANIALPNKNKIKPKKNKKYKYIEIGDISIDVREVDYTERWSDDLPPNARIPVFGEELIISKVRPTRGAIGIIPKELNDDVICSSAFSVFTVKSPMREFLYIVIRSLIGKLQMERATKGTSYPTIYDETVEGIKVPILSNEIQKKDS